MTQEDGWMEERLFVTEEEEWSVKSGVTEF